MSSCCLENYDISSQNWDLRILEGERGRLDWKCWCRVHSAHRPRDAEQRKIPENKPRGIQISIQFDALINSDSFTCLSKKPLPSGSAKSQIWKETSRKLWISKHRFATSFTRTLTFPNVMSGRPDFFKNKAASVGPTLPVFPGSTFKKHKKWVKYGFLLQKRLISYKNRSLWYSLQMLMWFVNRIMALPVCKSSRIQGSRLTANRGSKRKRNHII